MAAAVSTSDLRAWAKENGYQVGDRGRLPAEVRKAWEDAHGRPPMPRQGGAAPASEKVAPGPEVAELVRRVASLEQDVQHLRDRLASVEQRQVEQRPIEKRRLFARQR